jgi:hypothetical protein
MINSVKFCIDTPFEEAVDVLIDTIGAPLVPVRVVFLSWRAAAYFRGVDEAVLLVQRVASEP